MIKKTALGLLKYNPKSILKGMASYLVSDVVIVSFRKTGKTWLRLMLINAISNQYNIKNNFRINLIEIPLAKF